MIRKPAFDEVVEAIDRLSHEEQADLLRLIHHRLAERGRQRVIAEVAEAREDASHGQVRPLRVEEFLRDIEP